MNDTMNDTPTNHIDPVLTKLVNDRSSYDKCVDELMKRRHILDILKPHLDRLDIVRHVFLDKYDITVSAGLSGLYVHEEQGAFLMVHYLKHVKDVVPVLKYIRKHLGYKCTKVEDYPELKRRTYHCGPITVMAFLSWYGAQCEFVKVGVEEKPIYKLKCKDGNEQESV